MGGSVGQGLNTLGKNISAGTQALGNNINQGAQTLQNNINQGQTQLGNNLKLNSSNFNVNPGNSPLFKGVSTATPFGKSSLLAQGIGTVQNNIGQGTNAVGANLNGLGQYIGRQTGNPNNALSEGLERAGQNTEGIGQGYSKTFDSLNGPPPAAQNAPSPGTNSAPIAAGTYNGAQAGYQSGLLPYNASLNPNTNYNINAQSSPLSNAPMGGAMRSPGVPGGGK